MMGFNPFNYNVATPYITVSPIGRANGTAIANNGADYGPDTSGTTTSGIQEALTALEPTGGKLILLNGAFNITSAMTYTSDYSLTIEGETRGRAEFFTGSTEATGAILLVGSLGSGVFPLTVKITNGNMGMVRLSNFTMRGCALGSAGPAGAMRGVSFPYPYSPAQVEVDNVGFEYLTDPFSLQNGDDGPLIITWIGFFECVNGSSTMMEVVAGTVWIGHLESYNSGNILSFGGSDFMNMVIDSLWTTVGNALQAGLSGFNPATFTSIHVGQMAVGDPYGGTVLLLNGTGGSVYLNIGNLSQNIGSNTGYIVQGTGNSTSGQVQVSAGRYVGNYTKLIDASTGTVGAGSFVLLRNATLTAAPGSTDAKFANMTGFVEEVGSTYTQASLSGTTAGTAVSNFTAYGATAKRFAVYLGGYENTSGTSQTITFPYPFTNAPAITHDDSGGATVSATTLTLPNSMSSAKTGWIIVEGA
jgi:hypothetical protein